MTETYISEGKPEGKRPLRAPSVDGRTILKHPKEIWC